MRVCNFHHSKSYNLDSILPVIVSEFFEAAKGKIKPWQTGKAESMHKEHMAQEVQC